MIVSQQVICLLVLITLESSVKNTGSNTVDVHQSNIVVVFF